MIIRNYTNNDKTAVLRLFRANVPAYFSNAEEEGLLDYLQHSSENYFVIEEAGCLLGCGGFALDDEHTAVLTWDIIDPMWHKKGLGSALTQFRIRRIIETATIDRIVVRTSQLTYGFYEKFGFAIQEIKKDYWADGFDLYKMEKGLI